MDPKLLEKLLGMRLDLLCTGRRFQAHDMAEAYIRGSQYASRRYDWDGVFFGFGGDASIQAQHYVSMRDRCPSVRRDLPKLIVSRLTAMALGLEQWPEIKVPGDAAAEDYLKALCQMASIPAKMIEARNQGGASGVACLSFGFVSGKLRVRSHESKYMHPLRWADRDELVLGAVLKVYRYEQTEFVDGKPKQVPYYSVRYWDEQREIVWNPIPEPLAKAGTWPTRVASFESAHGYGECPVYWCQNLPDSEREDGISDFEGMLSRFDQINYLASATNKGTIANVDPTLVIKDDPANNSGIVQKGTGSAIYAKGGAEYLELEGTAVKAASEWCQRLEQWCLDEACVVVPDPQQLAAKAQSGEAYKMVFMPMAAQCDLLREQYGRLLVRLLTGILRACRAILAQPPGPIVTTEDGRRLQAVPWVEVPPRYEETTGPDGKPQVQVFERSPGTSEQLELNWHSYFPPTASDISSTVTSATQAKGQLISQKTATRAVAQIYGVRDIDAEVAALSEEREEAMALMQGPLFDAPSKGPPSKGSSKVDEE